MRCSGSSLLLVLWHQALGVGYPTKGLGEASAAFPLLLLSLPNPRVTWHPWPGKKRLSVAGFHSHTARRWLLSHSRALWLVPFLCVIQ